MAWEDYHKDEEQRIRNEEEQRRRYEEKQRPKSHWLRNLIIIASLPGLCCLVLIVLILSGAFVWSFP